jgi:uncharacterized protein (TIGR02268 family)
VAAEVIHMLSSLILVAILQQSSLDVGVGSAACEDQSIELAHPPSGSPREVCISPGLATTFVSDVPMASVDLEQEVFFEDVTRGRRMLGLMPPREMQPGERRRLTLTLSGGREPQQVSFTLVVHRGQATRQIEVFRDRRSFDSLRQEIEQARAKNQRLHQENERLLARIRSIRALSLLLSTDAAWPREVPVRQKSLSKSFTSDGSVSALRGNAYRVRNSIAVRLWLHNDSSEPWSVAGVSLVDAHGLERKGLQWSQERSVAPQGVDFVVVEAEAGEVEELTPMSLRFWDAGGRSITIFQVVFP